MTKLESVLLIILPVHILLSLALGEYFSVFLSLSLLALTGNRVVEKYGA